MPSDNVEGGKQDVLVSMLWRIQGNWKTEQTWEEWMLYLARCRQTLLRLVAMQEVDSDAAAEVWRLFSELEDMLSSDLSGIPGMVGEIAA